MNAAMTPARMTADDYLEWEAAQACRHEYIGGDIVAMTGARLDHNQIAGNLFVLLKQQLRQSPCRPFMSDMQVQASQTNDFFDPDVVVTGAPDDIADGSALTLRHPWFIAEVLSESTAAFDRGHQFECDRELPSLTHYLLVDTSRPRVDMHCNSDAGLWVLHPLGPEDTVHVVQPHALALPVADLFEGVTFEPGSVHLQRG